MLEPRPDALLHPFRHHVDGAVERILRAAGKQPFATPDDLAHLREAITLIASEGPTELRDIAKLVLNTLPDEGAIHLQVDDTARFNMNGAVQLIPAVRMVLFTAEGRTGLTHEVLLHEALHVAVGMRFGTLRDHLKRASSNAFDEPYEHVVAFSRFAKLWQDFRSTSQDDHFTDPQLEVAVTDARNSPDEFFALALTDTRFQSYLTTKKYRSESLFGRFKKWVRSSLLGIEENNAAGSWLDAALSASADVAKALASSNHTLAAEPRAHQDAEMILSRSREQEYSAEFKNWFRESKTLDPNTDQPMLFYHGTKSAFSTFDRKRAGSSDPGLVGKAFYFTPHAHQAAIFADSPFYGKGTTPTVMQVYLSIQNPAVIKDGILPDGSSLSSAHPNGMSKESAAQLQKRLRKAGHDGVIFMINGAVTQAAVFEPTQIKSATENIGSFDTGNPSILGAHSRVQEQSPEFQRWFGNSKVTDPMTGRPLVAFHGTRRSFSEFDSLKQGTASDAGYFGAGFYFTPDPANASNTYALGDGGNVMPVYLSIENPYDWRSEHENGLRANAMGVSLSMTADLIARGHDGVFVYEDRFQLRPDGSLSEAQWKMLTHASPLLELIGKEKIEESLKRREWSYYELASSYGRDFTMTLPRQRNLVEIVAFNPSQIKSAISNDGNFDPNSPDILRSRTAQPIVGTAETTEDCAKKNPVTASESDAFHAWFSDSVVTDRQGRPLIVYHGTNAEFTAFNKDNISDPEEGGFFFTPDRCRAQPYGDRVIAACLSIKNPWEIDCLSWMDGDYDDGESEGRVPLPHPEELMRQGYDGIRIIGDDSSAGDEDWEFGNDVWIAFEPTQIKSAFDNIGAFDPSAPDILRSRRATHAGADEVTPERDGSVDQAHPNAAAASDVLTRERARNQRPRC